jgi:hypothetical protein
MSRVWSIGEAKACYATARPRLKPQRSVPELKAA